MARIWGFSWPQFKAAMHEIAYGSTEFPGRLRGSRVATMLFASIAVDRRDLAANYRVSLNRLKDRNQDSEKRFKQVCIDQKVFLRHIRKSAAAFPEKISHYHFRKTLTNQSVANLVAALNKAFETDIFHHDGLGHFWVDPLQAKPKAASRFSPIETAIINALKLKNRSLRQSDICQVLLEDGVGFDLAQLNSALDSLFLQKIIKSAKEYQAEAVYLAENEQELIGTGELAHVLGSDKLYTQRAVAGYLSRENEKELIRIYGTEEFGLATMSFVMNAAPGYMLYYKDKEVYAIDAKILDIVKIKERLLFGLINGKKVAIQNTHSSRKSFAMALEAYELSRLERLAKEKSIDISDLLSQARSTSSFTKEPVYRILYRARKILEAGASYNLAEASIFCNVIYIHSEAPPVISQFQQIASLPISAKARTRNDYIDILARMQRTKTDNTDAILLYLAYKLCRAVYENDLMENDDWYEASSLCAFIAEQNGFDRLAEQFRDLYLMKKSPDKYLKAIALSENATRLDRWQTSQFLKTLSNEIKQLICEEWVGLDPDEVEVYFRPKSLFSIAVKSRKIHDFLGLRIVIKCKGEKGEQHSFETVQGLRDILKKHFHCKSQDDMIKEDDCLANPRASGLRHYKFVGRVATTPGFLSEIEIIAQTEQMYRFEKKASMRQNHAKYNAQKQDPDLEFEELPPATTSQMTFSRDINFQLLKDHDQKNNLLLFVAEDSEGKPLINPEDNILKVNLNCVPRKFPLMQRGGQTIAPTFEDIFCLSWPLKNHFLAELGLVEIYRPAFTKGGKCTLVKKKANGRGPHPENGDVIVFRRAKASSESTRIARLKHIAMTATHHLTKFAAWKTISKVVEQEKTSLVEQGRIKASALLDETLRKKQIKKKIVHHGPQKILENIAKSLGFHSPNDFFTSLALGFIDINLLSLSLSYALEESGCFYSIERPDAGKVIIEFSLPDRKGILRRLVDFGVITKDNLISLKTSSEQVFGSHRTNIKLCIDSQDFNEGNLISCLQSFFGVKPSGATYADTVTITYTEQPLLEINTITIPSPSSGRWGDFLELIDFVQNHSDMNIFKVFLPGPGQKNLPGKVKIEIPDKPDLKQELEDEAEAYGFTLEKDHDW